MAIMRVRCGTPCPRNHVSKQLTQSDCLCIPTTVERIVAGGPSQQPSGSLLPMSAMTTARGSGDLQDYVEPLNGYQQALIQVSAHYLQRDCREESKNRGVCVDEIKQIYGDKVPLDEAWCAQFVYATHRLAALKVRMTVTLPRTKGALDILNKSRGLFRIDRIPEIGDVLVRNSGVTGGSGKHNGNVVGISSEGITTIEGNIDNRVGARVYTWNDLQSPELDMVFIHVGELYRNSTIRINTLEFY